MAAQEPASTSKADSSRARKTGIARLSIVPADAAPVRRSGIARLVTVFFSAVLWTLASTALSVVNPANFYDTTAVATQKLTQRLVAPWYPWQARDRITVVTFDTATLWDIGQRWPVDLDTHWAVLETILAYRPRAVFVDIFYRNAPRGWPDKDRDSLVTLDTIIDGADPDGSHRPIPVFFADYYPTDRAQCPGRHVCAAESHAADAPDALLPYLAARSLEACFRNTVGDHRLVYATWSGYGPSYPLRLPPSTACAPDGGAPAAGASTATPAFALYRAVCRQPGARADTALPGCRDLSVLQADPSWPVDVRWGWFVSEQRRLLNSAADGQNDIWPCKATQDAGDHDSWSAKAGLVLRHLKDLVPVRWSRAPDHGPCSFHDIYPAAPLIDHVVPHNVFEDDPMMRRLIADRIILMGASSDIGRDEIVSPVHGRVSGINLHAMALDNLLTFGARYWRDLSHRYFLAVPWSEWLEIITLFVVGLLGFTGRELSEAARLGAASGVMSPTNLRRIFNILATLAPAAIGIVCATVLHVAPSNWVGLMVVSLVLWVTGVQTTLGQPARLMTARLFPRVE